MKYLQSACVFAFSLAACADPPTARSVAPVVYGEDDRRDVYDHPDPALRALAIESITALMHASDYDARNPMDVRFNGSDLQSAHNLCPTERFLTDPTPAFCSGTLIDDDLVLTAGHCITSANDCTNTRFVFGFYREDATHLHTVTTADVYRCTQLVARTQSTSGGLDLDFAVARLDRAATPRQRPAKVHLGAPAVAVGEQLACIGFGSGIPAKIDSGGHVRDARLLQRDYFLANTDTFGGNSGSGIFDLGTRELVGILVRGDTDYVAHGACNIVNHCASDACSGESITYGTRAIDDLCAHAGSARLCPLLADGGGVTVIDAGVIAAPDATVVDATVIDANATDAMVAADASLDAPSVETSVTASGDARADADEASVGGEGVMVGGGVGCSAARDTTPRTTWRVAVVFAMVAAGMRRKRAGR